MTNVTDGFSDADITEICQRVVKNSIPDSITAELEHQRCVKARGYGRVWYRYQHCTVLYHN